MSSYTPHPSSYRDPSGFIFEQDGNIFRQVNKVFKDEFDRFISSGCYQKLVDNGWLIPHERVIADITGDPQRYTILKPERIPFISYPYEWPFGMLKDAALLTLNILKQSLEHGMILKDASAYNIQWHKGRLVFIDSLSFERYDETRPWIAYRQFCEHFLSPLLLSYHAKRPLPELLLAYPDGIPLAITRSLLPWKSRFSMHTYLHIHLHAKYSERATGRANKTVAFSKKKLLTLVNSLEILIKKLDPGKNSNWSGYYEEAAERGSYLAHKRKLIESWLQKTKPATLADHGANTGEFTRLAASMNIPVIAVDSDAACIESLYRESTHKRMDSGDILPLVVDISKPPPSIGVNNNERASFIGRLHTDTALALALIHHLAIGKNIPFEKVAAYFQQTCQDLIIEFVPKEDEKVQFMLSQKKDIYTDYTEANFEKTFSHYFSIEKKEKIDDSDRTLYLLRKLP